MYLVKPPPPETRYLGRYPCSKQCTCFPLPEGSRADTQILRASTRPPVRGTLPDTLVTPKLTWGKHRSGGARTNRDAEVQGAGSRTGTVRTVLEETEPEPGLYSSNFTLLKHREEAFQRRNRPKRPLEPPEPCHARTVTEPEPGGR